MQCACAESPGSLVAQAVWCIFNKLACSGCCRCLLHGKSSLVRQACGGIRRARACFTHSCRSAKNNHSVDTLGFRSVSTSPSTVTIGPKARRHRRGAPKKIARHNLLRTQNRTPPTTPPTRRAGPRARPSGRRTCASHLDREHTHTAGPTFLQNSPAAASRIHLNPADPSLPHQPSTPAHTPPPTSRRLLIPPRSPPRFCENAQ